MLSIDEKGPTNPQVNKRVGCVSYPSYAKAGEAKSLALETGLYSKVKVIARPSGKFDVAMYVPIKDSNA